MQSMTAGEIRGLKDRGQVHDLAAVLDAIAHVQITVRRTIVLVGLMNIVGSRIQKRDDRQPNAMRPRIVRVEIHTPSGAPSRLEQHAVVALGSPIIVLSDVAEVGLRAHLIENSPLVHITSRRTRSWRNQAILPGGTVAGDILSRV